MKAMLYRFASARNLSDQYLRVYSERVSRRIPRRRLVFIG
ncbi:hypothetical protein C7S15_2151 [Burkholderia cepacia]|nr:hypothetical protein [Burkholderia cepacia]